MLGKFMDCFIAFNTHLISGYSSFHCVHNASGQPHSEQYHPVMVPARPAQWSHPGLWTSVLWEGNINGAALFTEAQFSQTSMEGFTSLCCSNISNNHW